jgi:CpeT protein
MKSKITLIALLISVRLFSQQQAFSNDLMKLSEMMIGSFSSEAQSKSDTSYFDIRLQVYPIWKNRTDGIWLYVEQAMAKRIDKPYRQRVYRLNDLQPGGVESAVFTMKSPLRFAGKPEDVEKLTPDSLSQREGCSVFLQRSGKKFVGATKEKTCPSDLKNAAYASSEVTITRKMMLSWDRGYNADGKQVWGAEKGGYRFVKKK